MRKPIYFLLRVYRSSTFPLSEIIICGHILTYQQRLLDGLRLLQLNPLIDSLSAELSTGIEPGINILEIKVVEANPWGAEVVGNNGRSPSVGSFRRGTGLSHQNFFGVFLVD